MTWGSKLDFLVSMSKSKGRILPALANRPVLSDHELFLVESAGYLLRGESTAITDIISYGILAGAYDLLDFVKVIKSVEAYVSKKRNDELESKRKSMSTKNG